MTADTIDRVFAAAFNTVQVVGSMPDEPVEAAAWLRKWCQIIRHRDPRLASLSDAQITAALGSV
jgi:hypothetical protein